MSRRRRIEARIKCQCGRTLAEVAVKHTPSLVVDWSSDEGWRADGTWGGFGYRGHFDRSRLERREVVNTRPHVSVDTWQPFRPYSTRTYTWRCKCGTVTRRNRRNIVASS